MNLRARTLVVLALSMAVGVAAVLFFNLRNIGRGSDPGFAVGAESRASSLATELETTKATDPQVSSVQRVAVAASALRDLDPEYAAALASFTGRLVTHDHQPAAERRVRLMSFDMRSILHDKVLADAEQPVEANLDAGEATSGGDGRFTIQGAWPRACYLLVAAVEADDQTHVIVERSPGPGETVDLGDIELEWAATITGALIESAGKPVAGAYVRAIDIPGIAAGAARLELFVPGEAIIVGEGKETTVVELPEWIEKRLAQLPMAVTRSDADGKFRLGGVRAGSNLFTIAAPGLLAHVNPTLRVKPGQTKDLGTITLGEGETVQGRVVDTEDKPIENAEVLVAAKSPAVPIHFARRTAPTDAKGRFTLSGVPPGTVLAAARRDKTCSWTVTEPHAAASDLVVKVPATHKVTLRFLSRKGLPLGTPKVQLVAGPFGGAAMNMAMFGLAPRLSLEKRTRTLEDGRLEIRELVAGHYQIGVRAAGHAPAESSFELTMDLERTIELDGESSLVVRVVDQTDRPVAHVSVHMAEEPGESGLPLYVGKTGSDGALVVKYSSASTKLNLAAQHPRYGVAAHEVGLPAQDTKIVLLTPGDVVGVVTEAGRPPTPAKWTIAVVPAGGGQTLPSMPRLATPDLQGRFVVRGLIPGSYSVATIPTLQAMRSIGSVVQFAMTMAMNRGGEGGETTEVVVRSGAVTEVRLEVQKKPLDPTLPAGHVQGNVFIDDKPAVGMILHAWSEGQCRAVVDDRGHFDFGRVRVGKIKIELTDPNADHGPLTALSMSQLWQQELEVKESGEHVVEILIRTSSLRGRVVRPDGGPAAGTFLMVKGRPFDKKGTEFATSIPVGCDDQGRFEVARVPEGEYLIQVEHSEHGQGELSGITVLNGSPVTELELRLRGTVSVRGKIDMQAFGGVERRGIYVSLQSESGGRAAGTRADEVDSMGTFAIDGVLPGIYRVHLWLWSAGESREYEHAGPITVGEKGLDGLVVVPKLIESGDKKGK